MPEPFFLFAPGAGAPSSHSWMQCWRKLLSGIGRVEVFDYDYMREGLRRPDPLPRLIAAHRQVLQGARQRNAGPIILIGKSMGGRVGCHLALEEKVEAVICLGYPLCAGGDRVKLRDQVLRALQTPVLFVQGTRDPLCPLELLDCIRADMQVQTTLHVVEGGDHSLQVSKSALQATNETQHDVNQRIVTAVTNFVEQFTAR